jgi:putative radical SAM enzyme (TIGR03279 family)
MKPPRSIAEGVVVAAVRPRTAGAAAGLAAGDRILTINGRGLRDAIDFQFYGAEDRLALTVERDGSRRTLAITRRPGGDLGLELEAPRPGEIATCANKCVFCFIHQLPKGMRRSLYVKDDDFRLSFLHGNYITLSDLDEPAFERILEQRLSPLYVSVHATDPELRWRLLGQPRHAVEILPRLERLAKAGIRVHARSCCVPTGTMGRTWSGRCTSWRRCIPCRHHGDRAGRAHASPRAPAGAAHTHGCRGRSAGGQGRRLASALPRVARQPLRVPR